MRQKRHNLRGGDPRNRGRFSPKARASAPAIISALAGMVSTGNTPTILTEALANPGGLAERALQSESPDGLAHSAICAMRRGEAPTHQAKAALEATLEWRQAWERWWEHYAPWHEMESRAQSAVQNWETRRREAQIASQCVDFYGGPLHLNDGPTAVTRMRGAFAQAKGLAGDPDADWESALESTLLHLPSGYPEVYDAFVHPNGFIIDDLYDRVRGEGGASPVGDTIIALWAHSHPNSSRRRRNMARRWATETAAPYLQAAREQKRITAGVLDEYVGTDFTDTVGADNIRKLCEAAEKAQDAGVRIADHQRTTLRQIERMSLDVPTDT